MIIKKILKHKILLIIIFLLATLTFWTIRSNSSIEVNHYSISGTQIPSNFEGFRIAQISDLHNEEFGEHNEELLTLLRDSNPDIIVITGDLIDCRNTDYGVAIRFCKEAVKIAPTYYITGNHESRVSELSLLTETLEYWGITYLANDFATITKDGQSIRLIGMTDPNFGSIFHHTSFEEVLQGLLPKDDAYTVLLSHRPELFETYVSFDVELALAGHAHGGQFRIPIIGGLYAPDQGIFPEYDSGLYTQDGTTMVVSRGLGNSIFPFRFNNPPELIIVELNNEK